MNFTKSSNQKFTRLSLNPVFGTRCTVFNQCDPDYGVFLCSTQLHKVLYPNRTNKKQSDTNRLCESKTGLTVVRLVGIIK